jgi:hypothetical protein
VNINFNNSTLGQILGANFMKIKTTKINSIQPKLFLFLKKNSIKNISNNSLVFFSYIVVC